MAYQQVPNLVQGVSQQAVQQRRDSQCEEQFDCINSAKDGAAARPQFDLVKLYAGRTLTNAFFQPFSRDDEEYLVGVYNDLCFAIDLADGTDCTVTQTAAATYLSTGSTKHREAVRMQPVEDTIFVLNRDATPAMTSTVTATPLPFAYIVAVGGDDVDHNMDIVIRNVTDATNYTYHVSWDADSNSPQGVMATAVYNAISGNSDGFSVAQNGATVKVWRADGKALTVTVDSKWEDEWYVVIQDEVASIDKLPKRGINGDILKVGGEKGVVDDDYYMKWVSKGSGGKWTEVVGPGSHTTIDPAKMPHLLVNTGYRTFEFKRATWSTRLAGDEETAKDPGFIGKKGRDLFYHASRLAIMYANGMVFSKSRFPFTFFPDTLQTVLAEAPVDIKAIGGQATAGSATLDFGVQVDESLFAWAKKVQFRITTVGNDVFKQETVDAKAATSYVYSRFADPVAVGSTLYFASEAGPWAILRALQLSQGRIVGDTEVTAHVPKYIQGPVRGIIASDTLASIFVWGDGDPDKLYLYNWVIEDSKYVQSGWNSWRVPGGNILWAGFTENYLNVLQQRPEGVALLRLNLTPQAVDDNPGAGYMTRLDLRVDQDGVTGLTHDADEGTSTFTLPYTPTGPDVRVVTSEDKAGGFTRGRIFPVTDVDGAEVTVTGDLTGYKFYVGQRISAERLESQFYIRTDKGPVPTERLSLNAFILEMANTGYTRIEVEVPNKPTKSYAFEGRKLDTFGSVTETVVPTNSPLRAPIAELAANAKVRSINDSYLPSYWQAASWDYSAVGIGREDYGGGRK